MNLHSTPINHIQINTAQIPHYLSFTIVSRIDHQFNHRSDGIKISIKHTVTYE